jgi:arylsulfatase A-like enzyme
VRKGRWKYIRAPYLELEQLFDMEADPGEQVNLLLDPAMAKVLGDMRNELIGYYRLADPFPSSFNRSQIEETRARLEAMGYGGGEEEPPR